MDRSTAKSYTSLKSEDPDRTRFTDAQYNNALDLSQAQFAIDARAIIKETTLTLTAGTGYVALPTDFLVCSLVRHKGLKLKPTTRYELSFQSGEDWEALANGTPTAYFIDEENERIYVVPAPDSGNAGAVLEMLYIAVPAAMSADTDTLLSSKTILQYYAPAIVAWAARELLSYVPLTQDVLVKRADLLAEYQRYVNQAISTYKNMADEPLRMTGGRNWQDTSGSTTNAFS